MDSTKQKNILSTHIGLKMPFKSKAQQGFMEAHRAQMEAQGVNMKEWEQASKGKKLPKRAKKKGKK